ncbi:MAG: hypothetical protein ABI594_02940 [Ginsengibacter sp.]
MLLPSATTTARLHKPGKDEALSRIILFKSTLSQSTGGAGEK